MLPALSFGLSVNAFLEVRLGDILTQRLWDWARIDGWAIELSLKVDHLSAFMILVVSGVGSIIHIYSIGYMGRDPGYARYFSYLNLFLCMMLILVMADNLVLMFVGWEGVGLCSYLLIGFWYRDIANADAGRKAFVVNRVGDAGFIIGILALGFVFGTLNISEIEGGTHTPSTLLTIATLLLFLGACGKSAQIPLYIWLPDAMAGPTPVSALIHAATMVTAGVYMISRLHFLFILCPLTMQVIGVVTALTALVAALLAVAQRDIKKILAYSTISQLAFMFMAVSATGFTSGLFHLMTHAFFKALLFLSCGVVIHALGVQDITQMGGLRRHLPLAFFCSLVGALAMAGFPPLAGFFSKDAILATLYEQGTNGEPLWFGIWGCAIFTAGITSFYIFRWVFRIFISPSKLEAQKLHHIHPAEISMRFALWVLAGLTIIGGIFQQRFLLFMPEHLTPQLSQTAHHLSLVLSLGAALVGLGLAVLLYLLKPALIDALLTSSRVARALYNFTHAKFYVDEFYHIIIVTPVNMLAKGAWWAVDRIIIDQGLIEGSAKITERTGKGLRVLHTGILNVGVVTVLMGVLIALLYLLSLLL
jgi:NADH-quinone oxidoreductase subunit L